MAWAVTCTHTAGSYGFQGLLPLLGNRHFSLPRGLEVTWMASHECQYPLGNVFQKSFRYKASDTILLHSISNSRFPIACLLLATCPVTRQNYPPTAYVSTGGAQRLQVQCPAAYKAPSCSREGVYSQMAVLWADPLKKALVIIQKCGLFPPPFLIWFFKRKRWKLPSSKAQRPHSLWSVPCSVTLLLVTVWPFPRTMGLPSETNRSHGQNILRSQDWAKQDDASTEMPLLVYNLHLLIVWVDWLICKTPEKLLWNLTEQEYFSFLLQLVISNHGLRQGSLGEGKDRASHWSLLSYRRQKDDVWGWRWKMNSYINSNIVTGNK